MQIFQISFIYEFDRGMHSAMVGIAVTQGVYYYWYEFVKAYFETYSESGKKRALTTAQGMAAGAIAGKRLSNWVKGRDCVGAATSILTNPVWVINVRLSHLAQS